MYHETGHVAMDMLAGGRRLDGLRGGIDSAFDRRALGPHYRVQRRLGHSSGDPGGAPGATAKDLRWRYQHYAVGFGDAPYRQNEYYRGASDLTTFSQDMARYYDVRENYFAFESAFRGPDYLRVQLEKARDPPCATRTNCCNRKASTPASSSCSPCAARTCPRKKPSPSGRIKMLRAMAHYVRRGENRYLHAVAARTGDRLHAPLSGASAPQSWTR
jgi:hypothetical protein